MRSFSLLLAATIAATAAGIVQLMVFNSDG
jgi:hypothetical protein